MFVPAVVAAPIAPAPVRRNRSARRGRKSGGGDGTIEIETGGVTVRIARGADVRAVAAVMTALKAAR